MAMYVCVCNAVTDRQIAQAMRSGARDLADVARQLGVGTNCGTCLSYAQEFIESNSVSHQNSIRPETDAYYPA